MMAATNDGKRIFTVTDAAKRFNRTGGRIRQICIAHNIGICYAEKVRMLSERDMLRIAEFIDPHWQPR